MRLDTADRKLHSDKTIWKSRMENRNLNLGVNQKEESKYVIENQETWGFQAIFQNSLFNILGAAECFVWQGKGKLSMFKGANW